jgi:hypothetical protein
VENKKVTTFTVIIVIFFIWFTSFFNFLLFGREGEFVISSESTDLPAENDSKSTDAVSDADVMDDGQEADYLIPIEKTKTVKDLIDNLVEEQDDERTKAFKIYGWIAKNIYYDDDDYNSGGFSFLKPADVLANRLAVCDGFSELYKVMATEAGLDTKKLTGYDKGFSNLSGSMPKRATHAWNAVKVDGDWILLDVTWGSGYGTKSFGRLQTTHKFTSKWFDVNPESFLYTHLPVEPQTDVIDANFQRVKTPIISKKDFFEFPAVSPQLTNLGFSPTHINKLINNKKTIRLVEAFGTQHDDIKIIKAPYGYFLSKDKVYDFDIESKHYKRVMLVNESDQIEVSKTGNNFRISQKFNKGELKIGLLADTTSKKYEIVLVYKVL